MLPLATAEDEVRSRLHETALKKFWKKIARLNMSHVGVSSFRTVKGLFHSEVFNACA